MPITNAVLEIWPLVCENVLKERKEYIFLGPFLCNFKWPKTSDNDFLEKDLNRPYLMCR